MSNQISWRVELTVKSGQLDSFLKLTGEMVDAARAERGVLSYQRFVADDGTCVHIYERYADSAAALGHLQMFEERFGRRFAGMVVRRRFAVYGTPSAELKSRLDGFGATFLRPFGDFMYWA